MYTVYCIHYTYRIHATHYTPYCTMQYTLLSTHYTEYSIHCIMHIVYSIAGVANRTASLGQYFCFHYLKVRSVAIGKLTIFYIVSINFFDDLFFGTPFSPVRAKKPVPPTKLNLQPSKNFPFLKKFFCPLKRQ